MGCSSSCCEIKEDGGSKIGCDEGCGNEVKEDEKNKKINNESNKNKVKEDEKNKKSNNESNKNKVKEDRKNKKNYNEGYKNKIKKDRKSKNGGDEGNENKVKEDDKKYSNKNEDNDKEDNKKKIFKDNKNITKDDSNKQIIKINNSSYNVIEVLGEGGGGKVKKLELDGKYFTLKIIEKNNDLDLYKNEISILKMFKHENIVKFIDSEESDKYLNIIMEFGGDSNLKNFIEKQKKNPFFIDEEIISKIIIQICFGLKEIHSKEIMHKDLTPENIFIDETNDYKIKIGDFGISTKEKTSKDSEGKLHYLAPEMLKGEEYNNKIDIYALGCIMYELFTLNVYYINKNIDKYVKKIDFDAYKKKWQYLTASLLDNDYNKRPDISKVVGQIDKYLYKTKENEKNEIKLDLIINEQDVGKEIYFLNDKNEDKKIGEIIKERYINDNKGNNLNYFIPEKEGNYNIKIIFKDFITDCSSMFEDLKNIEKIDLSNFVTKNVTSMESMFHNCENLKSINLSYFNTNKVENMKDMFNNCKSLMHIDLSFFDTKKVINMENIFKNCEKLESIDLSSFYTGNVIKMAQMFFGCTNLKQIIFSDFFINNVKTMKRMFKKCYKLEKVDLTSFKNTKNVVDMSEMFIDCFKLVEINLSSFTFKDEINMENMFNIIDNNIEKILINNNSFNKFLSRFPKLQNKIVLEYQSY